MLLRTLIFSTLAGGTAAAAAEPPLQPIEKWIVNFEGSQCVASRAYGSEEKPLHLVLKAPPVGEVMQLSVVRKGSRKRPAQVEATLKVDERLIETNVLIFGSSEDKLRTYQVNMPAAEFALLREAATLTVRSEGLYETFALSKMDQLLSVLDRCVADLRRTWNVAAPGVEESPLPTRAEGRWIASSTRNTIRP